MREYENRGNRYNSTQSHVSKLVCSEKETATTKRRDPNWEEFLWAVFISISVFSAYKILPPIQMNPYK